MSVTCGFYNGVNHDRRYDARQMSEIFDGIINDGVFMNIGNNMRVLSNPGNTDLKDMNVYVGTGKAWFNSTWTKNDAILPLKISESELVLDRIDAVVLEINANDSVRENSIKVLKGEPSSAPVHVDLENSEYVHQYPLAYVYVKAGVTEITQSEITNCIGTNECPFISGILQTVSAAILLAQWDDEFYDWFKEIKDVLSGDVAGNIYNQISDLSERVTTVEKGRIYTGVLKAGETTVSILNDNIKNNMAWSFYSEKHGINPIEVTIESGKVTLTFDEQESDMIVGVRMDSIESGDAYSGTLLAGETSISISGSAINTDSMISIYTSVYGVNPTDVSVTGGKITMKFEKQSMNIKVGVIIDG